MVKFIIIQVIIITCLVSCTPPRFSFKPAKITNDLIKLNGYYYAYEKDSDKLMVNILLYNTGMYYYGGGSEYKTNNY